MRFQIVVTTGNSERWIDQCIHSIADQECRWPWQCLIIDDASHDGTAQKIEATLSSIKNPAVRQSFRSWRNDIRQGALANQISGFEQLGSADNPMDVLIPIDGDDWLFSHTALDTIAALYEDTNCWITYGGLLTWPEGNLCTLPVPEDIIEASSYRESDWMTSHLRSFRAHLWNAIDRNDLLDQHGNYYDTAVDMATMFPMLEMAGERIACARKAVYVYNCKNPESHHTQRRDKQHNTELEIRAKAPYSRLTEARQEAEKTQDQIGYVLISDERPSQTIRLIKSLRTHHGSARIHCVHNYQQSILGRIEESERLTTSGLETMFSRGFFSEVEAMMDGINQALLQWPQLEWLILLDHQCHPILDFDELVTALENGGHDAYLHAEMINPEDLQSSWQETCWQRFGGQPGQHPFDQSFRCFAGSPWMALRRHAAEALVRFHQDQPWLSTHYRHQDECNGINYSCESYLHTILCNQSGLTISHQPICWTDWSSGMPKLLTSEDWNTLSKSGCWIATRFQEPQSNRLIDKIHDHWMLNKQRQRASTESIADPKELVHHQSSVANPESANIPVIAQP